MDIFEAAKTGNVEEVKKHIEAETKVYINKHNATVLRYAAERGHFEIVKLLIEAGADVNAAHRYGTTALMRTAEEGHFDVVQALIVAGANVNARDKYGATALKKALRNGHTEVADYLRKN